MGLILTFVSIVLGISLFIGGIIGGTTLVTKLLVTNNFTVLLILFGSFIILSAIAIILIALAKLKEEHKHEH